MDLRLLDVLSPLVAEALFVYALPIVVVFLQRLWWKWVKVLRHFLVNFLIQNLNI